MTNADIVKTMFGTLQWAARQASSPLLVFENYDPTFASFDVRVNLPGHEGEVYRVEAQKLRTEN